MSYTTAAKCRLPLSKLVPHTTIYVTGKQQTVYHVSPQCKQLDNRSNIREMNPRQYYGDTHLCPTCRRHRLTEVDKCD